VQTEGAVAAMCKRTMHCGGGAGGRCQWLSDSLPEGMAWRRIVTSQKYFWQRWQMILF
jgi:hypothetical protein